MPTCSYFLFHLRRRVLWPAVLSCGPGEPVLAPWPHFILSGGWPCPLGSGVGIGALWCRVGFYPMPGPVDPGPEMPIPWAASLVLAPGIGAQ